MKSDIKMGKIYLYKTANKSVSYDEEHWYVDNNPQQQNDGDGITEFKNYAASEAYRLVASDISKYTSHFKNVAVLTAAGTSMENGVHGGKTRTELWQSYEGEINAISSAITKKDGILQDKCQSIIESKNIEDFLSFTILYEKLNGEIKDKEGNSLRCKLEKKIADACRLILDENNRHHQDFIRKLTARKPTEPRVQLYTTNYDTLFEQAAQRMNYTIIDGFSFSYPRIFNGINFDHDVVYRERTRIKNEESFIPNVIQLFKLHGSIDWEKIDGKIYQKETTHQPCIIYPASEKYESSYEQPYFEMMSKYAFIKGILYTEFLLFFTTIRLFLPVFFIKYIPTVKRKFIRFSGFIYFSGLFLKFSEDLFSKETIKSLFCLKNSESRFFVKLSYSIFPMRKFFILLKIPISV